MKSNTASAEGHHANRLAHEKSPYLLQHQFNPVDWHPWGDEAFARAQREDKPVFLSIGYSTCHWCHVMERESFENDRLARLLNDHFISIKVDREERPDVDKIYMTFVQATTGQGGWPLNVFLTPDRKPFFGGTYFPPESTHGRPGFYQLLEHIHKLWRDRRDEIANSATDIHTRLAELSSKDAAAGQQTLTPDLLRRAGELLKAAYDPRHGGFGSAPKFPQPSQPLFVLRYATRFSDEEARRMVLHTCDCMAAGGIHDQLGGGFARYAVDSEWLVPHFEKMLYDNAQLAHLYLDAYLVSGESRHAAVARDILEYVLRDMTHPEGGFYSAEDADSEGHEGKFYCWTREELSRLLSPEELRVVVRYFGITERGNFVDHSHPHPLPNQNVLSVVDPNLAPDEHVVMASARQKMFAARSRRVRPHLDDKVLASWNGLMLGAVARGGIVLQEPRYRAAAEKNVTFLKERLWDAGSKTLFHRWRDGEHDYAQLLEAYAFLLSGVLELYESTLEPGHLEFAITLAEAMVEKFYDREHGGFWQSPPGNSDLILRIKEDYDGAEPSGNSVAVVSLLKLGRITGREEFSDAAQTTLQFFSGRLQQIPQALSYLLQAVDFGLEEARRAVLTGAPEAARPLLHAVHAVYQPNKVVLGTNGPVEPFARTLPAGPRPQVYVCAGTACQAPTDDTAQVLRLLQQGRRQVTGSDSVGS